MTFVNFIADKNGLCGFKISGHSSSSCDDTVGKTVCAAVSSAAYLVANTVTDVIGDRATASVDDADMFFSVKDPSESSRALLEGLKLHFMQLSDQYSDNIRINGGAK